MCQVIFILWLLFSVGRCTIWDFGEDFRHSKLIAHSTGRMTALEKIKHVSITVPYCMKITYVRVEVKNAKTTPAVSYNKHTNKVSIYYKPAQSSQCRYDIAARAIWDTACGTEPTYRKKKKS